MPPGCHVAHEIRSRQRFQTQRARRDGSRTADVRHFVNVVFAGCLENESAFPLSCCGRICRGRLVGRWNWRLWGRSALNCWVGVGAFTGRVALGGWSRLAAVHLYIVKDVGVLIVGVGFVLRHGVCCHVAVDGVDSGIAGSLLPSLILLVMWVKDGSSCPKVSGFLCGL